MTKKNRTVAIAEDEYLISIDVADSARRAGYEVVGVAPNGEKVLELIAQHSPDVAILDIKMPVMDGLEAARQIRDRFNIPVVIMSAFESPEFLHEAKDAGVGAYLIKPPMAMNIMRAVEVAVARHEDMRELARVNEQLREAISRIKTLEGIIPICMYCKKMRTEDKDWVRLEEYITEHSDAQLSHSICPDCHAANRYLED